MLVGNFACVALIVSAWMHASYRWCRLTPRQQQACFGAVLGAAAATSMSLAVELGPGVHFDLRVALIEVAALFGGPLSLLVAAGLAAAFRVVLGGADLLSGLAGILVAAAAGLAVRGWLGRGRAIGLAAVPVFAALVGALSLVVLATLPPEAFRPVLAGFGLPIALLNVAAAALAALVMIYFRRFTLERDVLRAALAQAPDFHYVKTLDQRFVVTNQNLARRYGRGRVSDMTGLSERDLEPGERAEAALAAERRVIETGEPLIRQEERIRGEDGEARWYSTSKFPLRDPHGALIGIAGVSVDITERKRLEQELKTSRDVVAQAMAEMTDGLALFDREGYLLFCNQQYRDLFPLSAYARVEGAHIVDIVRAVTRNGERKDVPPDVPEERIRAAAGTLHRNKDETIPLFDGRWLNLRTRVGDGGSALVVVTDITAAKESELGLRRLAEKMKGLAETDALTGVANRRSFDERLAAELSRSAASGRPLSLLLMDVDCFKAFNDTYGHLAGDECLRRVGACLKEAARRPRDLAARYGGEEFAVILPETDAETALAIAGRLCRAVRSLAIPHAPSEFGTVTTSVGVATATEAGATTPAALVLEADRALYRAKAGGRDRAVLSSLPAAA